jgi:multiple sugar transport system permease protein
MMTLWADSGYNIVIFMAGLDSIPVVYYEAAMLDGAKRWVMFRHVTLPLLNRTTIFISITTIISYFQAFAQFQVMTKGEPFNETRVLALNIYDNAFTYSNMGYASAMATVLLVIILVITQLQVKLGRSQWEY